MAKDCKRYEKYAVCARQRFLDMMRHSLMGLEPPIKKSRIGPVGRAQSKRFSTLSLRIMAS